MGKHGQEAQKQKTEFAYNPYISCLRPIIEDILRQRGQLYQDFYPVIIDAEQVCMEDGLETDYEQQRMWERRLEIIDGQLEEMIGQLLPELNHLQIRTDRPDYFAATSEQIYRSQGLVLEILPKETGTYPRAGIIFDMETEGTIDKNMAAENIPCILVYRRRWHIAQNLDIAVPIGYNTVIVKGTFYRDRTRYQDRLEREFYN